MTGGIRPHGSGNRSAAQRAHEYQVYKNIAGNTGFGSGNFHNSSDSGAYYRVLPVLAAVAGIVSAASPVIEGFLFWGTLVFLFLRFAFS